MTMGDTRLLNDIGWHKVSKFYQFEATSGRTLVCNTHLDIDWRLIMTINVDFEQHVIIVWCLHTHGTVWISLYYQLTTSIHTRHNVNQSLLSTDHVYIHIHSTVWISLYHQLTMSTYTRHSVNQSLPSTNHVIINSRTFSHSTFSLLSPILNPFIPEWVPQ